VPRLWTLFDHERHLWSGENDGEPGHPHPAHDDGTVMNGAPLVFWVMIGPPARAALNCGFDVVAPYDLRRTCARLCHQAGGELEQIQFLLGHSSVQRTERYIGCKQPLTDAVNDHLGLGIAS